jgi:hypothetical protein
MKTYQANYNKAINKGVFAISLVESPAMEGNFIALNKNEEIQFKEVDKEQRILMGLVLEPNKPIYRNQNGEEFNIVFNEETIKELSHGFFQFGNQSNSTIEHEPTQKIEGVTFVESWIVEDSKIDKSANFGFSYPKGSWIATMKVDSSDVWENYVKTGKVKGFSIDAMLSLEEVNLKSSIIMSKQEENNFIVALKDMFADFKASFSKEAEVKLGMIATADGALEVMYDGAMLMVGEPVYVMAADDTKVPLPIGEYPLEDGMTLVVTEEGLVGELKDPAAAEAAPAAEVPAALEQDGASAMSPEDVQSAVDQIKSILIKYGTETEAKFSAMEKQITELGKQPASNGIKQTAVTLNQTRSTNFSDFVNSKLNK